MNQPGRFRFVGAIFITAIIVHAFPVPAQEPQHFSTKADPQSNSGEAMQPGPMPASLSFPFAPRGLQDRCTRISPTLVTFPTAPERQFTSPARIHGRT